MDLIARFRRKFTFLTIISCSYMLTSLTQVLANSPSPDLLDTIKQNGLVRIGVSPDLPGMSRRIAGKPGFEGAEASLALLIGSKLIGDAKKLNLSALIHQSD